MRNCSSRNYTEAMCCKQDENDNVHLYLTQAEKLVTQIVLVAVPSALLGFKNNQSNQKSNNVEVGSRQ